MFYTGKTLSVIEQGWYLLSFEQNSNKVLDYERSTLSMLLCICVCRCIHPDRSWSTDDGGGLSGMLWGYPGVPLYAGTGSYHFFVLHVTLLSYSINLI